MFENMGTSVERMWGWPSGGYLASVPNRVCCWPHHLFKNSSHNLVKYREDNRI